MKGWRRGLAALALVAGLVVPRPARASFIEDAGWGVLTIATNVFYMPAKFAYATIGGVTGGFAFALTGGDMQTAEAIWVPTMSGTYVVTPRMLQGQEPIYFAGGGPSGTDTNTSSSGGIQEQPLGGS